MSSVKKLYWLINPKRTACVFTTLLDHFCPHLRSLEATTTDKNEGDAANCNMHFALKSIHKHTQSFQTGFLMAKTKNLTHKNTFISTENRATNIKSLFNCPWNPSPYIKSSIIGGKEQTTWGQGTLKSTTCNQEVLALTFSQSGPFLLPLISTSDQPQVSGLGELLSHGQRAPLLWTKSLSVQPNAWSNMTVYLYVSELKHGRIIMSKIMNKNPRSWFLINPTIVWEI